MQKKTDMCAGNTACMRSLKGAAIISMLLVRPVLVVLGIFLAAVALPVSAALPVGLPVFSPSEDGTQYVYSVTVAKDGKSIHQFSGLAMNGLPVHAQKSMHMLVQKNVAWDTRSDEDWTGYAISLSCRRAEKLGPKMLQCSFNSTLKDEIKEPVSSDDKRQAEVVYSITDYRITDQFLSDGSTEYLYNKDGYTVKITTKVID